MNSKLKNFFMNSASSVLYQITNAIIVLITRNIFLNYIGVELLGINSTISSLINAFSLTELGFQGVIIYNLYKPLNEKDYDQINKIMSIYKNVYRAIALVVLVSGLIFLPFLPYLLKGIYITRIIIFIYILQLVNVSFSYLLSYKRTLMYADNKDYYSKFVDMIFRISINVIKIIVVIYTQSMLLFLLLDIIYTVVSNFFVHIFCKKLFPYLKNEKFDKQLFLKLFKDVKDVFFGKVSGYIYSSTDNLVISSLIGPSTVTLLTNYTSLILQLKSLVNSILYPVIPIIGRNISKNKNTELMFNMYSELRYFFAGTILIPTYLLIDDFIILWIGDKFILSMLLKVLLMIDFYITIVYAPCYEFNNSCGLFAFEKKIMLFGALLNIIISITLSFFIGLEGVLIGTSISQLFLWGARSYICFNNVLKSGNSSFFKYWIKNFINILIIILLILVLSIFKSLVLSDISVLNFILWGFISVFLYWIVYYLNYKNTSFVKYIINMIRVIGKRDE